MSASLLTLASSLAATKTSQETHEQNQSLPRLVREKPFDEYIVEWEEKDRKDQERWHSQQLPFQGYDTNAAVNLVSSALNQLGIQERPLTTGQCSYVKSPDGKTTLSHHKEVQETHKIRDYGLSQTKVAYVANDNQAHRETFTSTLPKGQTYKNGRKHPFHAFSLKLNGVTIDFDAGHGIDQADTVVRNGRNSSTDPQNFTPQNRFYNQNIRNHMVQHTIRPNGGAYKEISIYDDTKPIHVTLSSKEKCELPVGFIFIAFENHQISRTFYFPNLISYENLIREKGLKPDYKSMMDYFEIQPNSVSNDIIGQGEVDEHTRTLREHEERGYRSLSGRYDPVSHVKMPRPAKAALRRYLARHHLEQASHLEFRSIENKAALVRIYTDKMKYIHLDNASATEKAERQAQYWKAYKDEEAVLAKELGVPPDQINLADYAIDFNVLHRRLNNQIPQDNLWEQALKRVQNTQKKLEEGQGLYYPERAKTWLKRIEKTVDDNPVIDDLIKLLELYDIPELTNSEKRNHFEKLLIQQGKTASLEEQKSIGDYFYYQLRDGDREGEKAQLEKHVSHWLTIIEKGIFESRKITEITEAAEWYHKGYGIIQRDREKARALYKILLPYADKAERRRIRYCLKSLKDEASYERHQKDEES